MVLNCEHIISYESIIITLSLSLVITIGWEMTSYDTSEDEDMVELCAVIQSPAVIDRDPFTLQVACSPGSAGNN